jgi:hypothetical protein
MVLAGLGAIDVNLRYTLFHTLFVGDPSLHKPKRGKKPGAVAVVSSSPFLALVAAGFSFQMDKNLVLLLDHGARPIVRSSQVCFK